MDINEQLNGIMLLGILPVILTFLSHAGGHLYYKPNRQHELNLNDLTDKIYNSWKLDGEDKKTTAISAEIVDYTKYNMKELYLGHLLERYHETLGNSEDRPDKSEMRTYYNVSDNNDFEGKKVGAIEKMSKDLYYGLTMIFWPMITMASYILNQFQQKERDEDSNEDSNEESGKTPQLTNLNMAFRVFREKYLASSEDEDEGIQEQYSKYIKKLPFQALWILEGGIGNAIKLSWVGFLIFVIIIAATLYTTGGAFQFLGSLSDYQNKKQADLTVLTNPFLIYCIGYVFIIYVNRTLFKKSDGNITIFSPMEFFKINTFIMWNLLVSFFLFSIQMEKSREFKDNYVFAFNLIVLLIFLIYNLRQK